MVVEASCCVVVGGVNRVDVVAIVDKVTADRQAVMTQKTVVPAGANSRWIERLHSQRAQQERLRVDNGLPGILGGEQLRGHRHGNAEVGPQLEICVTLCGPHTILVDTRTMEVACLRPLPLTSHGPVRWDPELLFKVLSQPLTPDTEAQEFGN